MENFLKFLKKQKNNNNLIKNVYYSIGATAGVIVIVELPKSAILSKKSFPMSRFSRVMFLCWIPLSARYFKPFKLL